MMERPTRQGQTNRYRTDGHRKKGKGIKPYIKGSREREQNIHLWEERQIL
jgi:hypothetical protein